MIKFKEYQDRFGLYEGTHVPLEQPMIEEADPELNSPKRGGKKKFVAVHCTAFDIVLQ